MVEAGFDLNLTGFDEFELGELFPERTQGRIDPDDAPECGSSSKWDPGRNLIYHADFIDNIVSQPGSRSAPIRTPPPNQFCA
jgi:hypothetical protein